ncbi:hypothetical protein EGW08_004433 [Elysia chlorotica]|uniref:UPAR/Ly6 domain-containing protein n=1 Tax=Elysia chlorotica TaxID=188477 RepID=A0A3S1BNI6_ELYCH|nr:hypothetical protein EGW08_004433 [Elysia chlorotica]
MNSWKVLGAVLLLSVFVEDALGFPKFEWMAHKLSENSADLLRQASKRSEQAKRFGGGDKDNDGQLKCYGCRNTDPDSSSCSGTVELCQTGEVCASIFHSDNTNLDGCLAATICSELAKAPGIYARCCSSDMCNMTLSCQRTPKTWTGVLKTPNQLSRGYGVEVVEAQIRPNVPGSKNVN